MRKVYLDYAGTTPCDPEVIKAMQPYFYDIFGNPSSIHQHGQEAKKAVEVARQILASFLGASPEEIFFTSGGTESDNWAIKGIALANQSKGNHIITSVIEHHAVSETTQFLEKKGFKVSYVKVDKEGLINPDDIRRVITKETILISIMHANNEIGVIQPITEIGKIAKEKDICFHTDAVQTVGHIPVDVNEMNIDLLSLSAHKFYGPKGVGALYIRKGTKISRFLHGGDQEKGKRASTSNVTGIVGLGKAIELCRDKMSKEIEFQIKLRDQLTKFIQENIEDIRINGGLVKRLPNNVNVSFQYIEGESIILNLDLLGIAASTGSACTSSSLEPSHVLLAIGLPHELAHGSLRFTLGRWTTQNDVNYLMKVLPGIIDKLRRMSPLYPSA